MMTSSNGTPTKMAANHRREGKKQISSVTQLTPRLAVAPWPPTGVVRRPRMNDQKAAGAGMGA
jgi:hypothetical protein